MSWFPTNIERELGIDSEEEDVSPLGIPWSPIWIEDPD